MYIFSLSNFLYKTSGKNSIHNLSLRSFWCCVVSGAQPGGGRKPRHAAAYALPRTQVFPVNRVRCTVNRQLTLVLFLCTVVHLYYLSCTAYTCTGTVYCLSRQLYTCTVTLQVYSDIGISYGIRQNCTLVLNAAVLDVHKLPRWKLYSFMINNDYDLIYMLVWLPY